MDNPSFLTFRVTVGDGLPFAPRPPPGRGQVGERPRRIALRVVRGGGWKGQPDGLHSAPSEHFIQMRERVHSVAGMPFPRHAAGREPTGGREDGSYG